MSVHTRARIVPGCPFTLVTQAVKVVHFALAGLTPSSTFGAAAERGPEAMRQPVRTAGLGPAPPYDLVPSVE